MKFNTEIELSRHSDSEHATQTRVCSLCEVTFHKMSALEWAKEQHEHEEYDCVAKNQVRFDLKEYMCELCDLKSTSEENLQEHIKEAHAMNAVGPKYVTPPPKKPKKEDNTDDDIYTDMDTD